MKNHKCLIVDDERLARELIETYLGKFPGFEVVGQCGTAMEALTFLQKNEVDVLFLDIQMPDLTGIDLLKNLKKQPATIFTTAYSEHALEGYELGVVDYLLKPIEFERFFKTVSKLNELLSDKSTPKIIENSTVVSSNEPKQEDAFFIKSDGKIVQIKFNDVLYIEALQKYIRIHTSAKKYISLISMSHILDKLPTNKFVRIHRSFIVNIDKIENIEGNMVRVEGQTLPVSKGQKDLLLEAIKRKGFFE